MPQGSRASVTSLPFLPLPVRRPCPRVPTRKRLTAVSEHADPCPGPPFPASLSAGPAHTPSQQLIQTATLCTPTPESLCPTHRELGRGASRRVCARRLAGSGWGKTH